MLIGDSADIKYKTGLEDENKAIEKTLVNRAMKKFKVEEDKRSEEPEQVVEEVDDNSTKEEKVNQLTGLMARRI
jgi:hypothetical protein